MDRPIRHTRESRRLINRRQQGDLGEASAIEWLTRMGAHVWTPLGHSPDADLIAEVGTGVFRIQVKTSTHRVRTPNGHERWYVGLATNGGNQSWSGVAKLFDASRCDYLFVLTGDGQRWCIPADAVESKRGITLGGQKYSEFGIERGQPIEHLVYRGAKPALESNGAPGEYRSGQTGGAVNAMALSFAGSNPASPISANAAVPLPKFERALGRIGQAKIFGKRRITIPLTPFLEAGLNVGDRVRVLAAGEGRVVLERLD